MRPTGPTILTVPSPVASPGRRRGPARARLGRGVRALAATTVFAGAALAGSATGAEAAGDGYELIAHRGGIDGTPESTLAAFDRAIDVGSDGIEFDVQFTRDGRAVVLHDSTLNRTTDCSGPVREISYAKLRDCDAGSWYDRDFRGEKVPSLDEALAYISGRSSDVRLYVHVRTSDSGEARKIVRALEQKGLNTGRTTIIAGSQNNLAAMKAAGARRLGWVFTTAAGWSANYPVLVPYNVTVNRSLVAAAQARGVHVLLVEDQPVGVDDFAGLGVNGIMANDLDDAIDAIEDAERFDEAAREDRQDEQRRDEQRRDEQRRDEQRQDEQRQEQDRRDERPSSNERAVEGADGADGSSGRDGADGADAGGGSGGSGGSGG